MKGLELVIYLLFALAVFFAFGMFLYSAIALLIAFVLIDRVKKYDKDKAKKLNYIGIGIVILVIILYLITAFLAHTFVSGLLRTVMPTNLTRSNQTSNSVLPHANSSSPSNWYYNSSDNTFYCNGQSSSGTICNDLMKNCTDSKLKIYGIVFLYGSYAEAIGITKNGQSCEIIKNVTDANVTKEVLLQNVSMVCNLPMMNGKVLTSEEMGLERALSYCQQYDVLLTPKNV